MPPAVPVTSEPQMKCQTGTTACNINKAFSLLLTSDCLWLGSSSQGCGLMLLLLFFVVRTGVLAKTDSCYNNKAWRAPALLYAELYWYRGEPTTTKSVDNQQPIWLKGRDGRSARDCSLSWSFFMGCDSVTVRRRSWPPQEAIWFKGKHVCKIVTYLSHKHTENRHEMHQTHINVWLGVHPPHTYSLYINRTWRCNDVQNSVWGL